MTNDELLQRRMLAGTSAIAILEALRKYGYIPPHHRAHVDEVLASYPQDAPSEDAPADPQPALHA